MTAKKKTVAVVSENQVYPLWADNFLPPRQLLRISQFAFLDAYRGGLSRAHACSVMEVTDRGLRVQTQSSSPDDNGCDGDG